ncbi:MAG: hypothetical protein HQK77_10080 [Desulfobacterales bacterium]|nr:hypothetical protein [Desulfobacterales bacterium]
MVTFIKKAFSFHPSMKYSQRSLKMNAWFPIIMSVVSLFIMLIGIPSVLIFMIYSPLLDQPFSILGIAYWDLLCVFFTSAALIAYISLFLIKPHPILVLIYFALSIFGCFPFIAGLRNHLPLDSVFLDLPLFSHWLYFLKPAYLLIVIVIPIGFLINLWLFFQSLFLKKEYRVKYLFFMIALYLCLADFIGFSCLIQMNQPNIVSMALHLFQGQSLPTEAEQPQNSINAPEQPKTLTFTIPSPSVSQTIPEEVQGKKLNYGDRVQGLPTEESDSQAQLKVLLNQLEKMIQALSINSNIKVNNLEERVTRDIADPVGAMDYIHSIELHLKEAADELHQVKMVLGKDDREKQNEMRAIQSSENEPTNLKNDTILEKMNQLSEKVDHIWNRLNISELPVKSSQPDNTTDLTEQNELDSHKNKHRNQ